MAVTTLRIFINSYRLPISRSPTIFNLNNSFPPVYWKTHGLLSRVESGAPHPQRLLRLLSFQFDLLPEIGRYEFINDKSDGQDQ